jgi:hypothetical protein
MRFMSVSVSGERDESTSFARNTCVGLCLYEAQCRDSMARFIPPLSSSTLVGVEGFLGLGPLRRVKRGDRVIKRLQELGLGLCGVFLVRGMEQEGKPSTIDQYLGYPACLPKWKL